MSGSIRVLTTGLMLGALPALALAGFAPSAWQARAVPDPVFAAVPAVAVASAQQPLTAWTETYNPTPAQVAALDAFYHKQSLQYMATYKAQTAQSLTYVNAHYAGQRLATYLHLIYKNRSLNNVHFTSYRRSLVISLYQNGVLSSTPFSFHNLL